MFYYCQGLSQYYLHLEDDVISKPDYMEQIRRFIDLKADTRWDVLWFSRWGFIGKLFQDKDLRNFSRFITMFYSEMPVDWLLFQYIKLRAGERSFDDIKKEITSKTELFHHIGKQSSSLGTWQWLPVLTVNLWARCDDNWLYGEWFSCNHLDVYQNESCTLLRIKLTAKLGTCCLVLRTSLGRVNKKEFCFNCQLNVSTTFRACRYVHALNISTARMHVLQALLICSHSRHQLLWSDNCALMADTGTRKTNLRSMID